MPQLPDYQTALALAQKGAISAETFNQMYPDGQNTFSQGVGGDPYADPSASAAAAPAAPFVAPEAPAAPVPDVGADGMSVYGDSSSAAPVRGTAAPEPAAAAAPAGNQVASTQPNAELVSSMGRGNPNIKLATTGASADPGEGQDPYLTMLPRMMEGTNAAYDNLAKAYMSGAGAANARGRQSAEQLHQMQVDNTQRLQADQDREVARQKQADEVEKQVNAAAGALSGIKVDPNRMWANASTGDKIMAGIGLVLGAFGDKGNQAVPVIERAINRDIDIQKADIQTAKDAYTAKSGLYAHMLSRFNDQRVAEAATRHAYLQNAELKLQEIAARYSGGDASAKAQVAVAQLELAKQQNMQQLLRSLPPPANANPQYLSDDVREQFIPGFGVAPKSDAPKLREFLGQANTTKSNVTRLMQIANTPGADTDLGLRAEASSLATAVQGSLKDEIFGGPRLNEQEIKMLENVVVDPTKLFSLGDVNMAKLKTVNNIVDRSIAGRMQAVGLKPSTAASINAKPGLAPSAAPTTPGFGTLTKAKK